MEKFETKLDDNTLKIFLKTSSDAILDGPNKIFFTIYTKDKPKKWRKVIVKRESPNTFSAEIVKTRLQKRPILKMRSNYIVDNIDLKESIAKVSTVTYNLEDTLNSKDYVSKHQSNKDEYDLGRSDDETFSITKRVNIVLT